jgi:hypothetical protein
MKRRPIVAAVPLVGLLAMLTVGGIAAQEESTTPAAADGPLITVTAFEYGFGDLPTSVPAGTSLALTNIGADLHEMILVRKNDGVTETWDELIALPEEEAFQKATALGPLFAAPGEAAAIGIGATGPEPMTAITVELEGDYIALCFIPQGMTELPDFGTEALSSPGASAAGEPAPPEGPPHFVLGMRQEFTVTSAGSSPGPMPSAAAAAVSAESPEA